MAESKSSRSTDARCACGSLLARVTPRGIELKCRRCKRIVVIPLGRTAAARASPRDG
jgi:phage FluMu protein Com